MKTNPTIQIPPVLFVPHGSPMWLLRPGAAGAALAAEAAKLPPLRAVVVVSPHWDTSRPNVGYASKLETIHDFWGFPEALYSIRYPATGCREAADEVQACLHAAGFAVEADASRGLDHGAWIPLRMMFPDADVPVVPLSVQSRSDPAHHLAVGRALVPLARRGIAVVASGNLTHNLVDVQYGRTTGNGAFPYVRGFADWVWDKLAAGDLAALLDYQRQAPEARRAHPEPSHLLPLFVAIGAAGGGFAAERFHAGIDEFALAMDGFVFRSRQRANEHGNEVSCASRRTEEDVTPTEGDYI
jgi:4,5-DOPA dioxygenase extradiol